MSAHHIRSIEPRDHAQWTKLRAALWTDQPAEDLGRECARHFDGEPAAALVFVCEQEGRLIGMVEADLRNVAEGCTSSPVPFIEGWYVAPEARRRGVGRALIGAVENWARAQGFTEMGSDALLENTLSHTAHASLGFKEVERLVAFRKALD